MASPRQPVSVLTYEDYLAFPDDGIRHEILDGEHAMTPTPTPDHQYVAGSFGYWFRLQVPNGVLYSSPVEVLLAPTTIVEPDVCYLGPDRLARLTRRGIDGAPDIVAEILSPSTWRRDEVGKRQLYARYGVGEYWIVDVKRACMRVCVQATGFSPAADRLLTGTDRLTSPLAPGLDLPVAELFPPPSLRCR